MCMHVCWYVLNYTMQIIQIYSRIIFYLLKARLIHLISIICRSGSVSAAIGYTVPLPILFLFLTHVFCKLLPPLIFVVTRLALTYNLLLFLKTAWSCSSSRVIITLGPFLTHHATNRLLFALQELVEYMLIPMTYFTDILNVTQTFYIQLQTLGG